VCLVIATCPTHHSLLDCVIGAAVRDLYIIQFFFIWHPECCALLVSYIPIQCLIFQYSVLYSNTVSYIPIQCLIFQYSVLYSNTESYIPIQCLIFQYSVLYSNTVSYIPIQCNPNLTCPLPPSTLYRETKFCEYKSIVIYYYFYLPPPTMAICGGLCLCVVCRFISNISNFMLAVLLGYDTV
jgi:hypothetical protein